MIHELEKFKKQVETEKCDMQTALEEAEVLITKNRKVTHIAIKYSVSNH